MELQFETRMIPCLRRDLWESLDREEIQEVRLPEGMPDIGSVVAARGQCVVRSKEWLGDSVSVSGGVMVWVLYTPADGSQTQVVEAWVPVQGKWSIPQTRREGSIRASICLRSADARTTSARKMMVRVQVGLLAEVLEPWEAELAVPPQTGEDIQLLRRTYPAVLPREAGELAFSLEEELPLGPGSPKPERIVYCTLENGLREQKVVGSRVVFRGDMRLHLLCQGSDGQLFTAELEAPFSQFSDLDGDYDKEATADAVMAVTNFEPELAEGMVRLKCGLLAQYVVYDCRMVELVEDAYSTRRDVTAQQQPLELPLVLDRCADTLRCETAVGGVDGRVVDSWICAADPRQRQAGELAELEFSGTAGVLYRDENGDLRSVVTPWTHTWELAAGHSSAMQGRLLGITAPTVVPEGDGVALRGELDTFAQIVAAEPMSMVSALEIGEEKVPDRSRPSLILRRSGEQSLWEMAKLCGSTVEAICRANGLSAEPMDGRILLIPVS